MAEALGDGMAVEVEVMLLVLRLPDGQRGTAGSMPCPSVQQQRFGVGPSVPLPLRQQKPQPQRLPASSWNMLSAIAGGASSSASKAAMSTPAEPADLPAASAGAASAGRQPAMHPASLQQQPRDIPNFWGGSRRQQQQQQKPAEAPPQQLAPARAAGSAVHQHAPLQEPGIRVQVAQPPGVSSQQQQSQEQHKRMTVGDYLVNSLTAQSLDLPPAVSSHNLCQAFWHGWSMPISQACSSDRLADRLKNLRGDCPSVAKLAQADKWLNNIYSLPERSS